MAKKMEAHLHEEFKLCSFIVLSKTNQECKEEKERNLTWRNSRGEKLQDIFWALPGVHFIHTICRFEAREVRSPTFQTVCKLKLKWRSYGNWKTTVPSWKTISQVAKLQIQLAKFSQVKFQLEKSTCVIPDIYDRLC